MEDKKKVWKIKELKSKIFELKRSLNDETDTYIPYVGITIGYSNVTYRLTNEEKTLILNRLITNATVELNKLLETEGGETT